MFRWIEVERFPVVIPPMQIYLLVTDAVGLDLWQIGCALVDAEEMFNDEALPVKYAGRMALNRGLVKGVYDARFVVPELELTHPGKYDLHVDIDEELVDLIGLHVVEKSR